MCVTVGATKLPFARMTTSARVTPKAVRGRKSCGW